MQFQPQIDVATHEIVAAEALVRWQHPELGLLSPGEFIPLAEDSNLITEVGAHVITQACRAGARWRAEGYPIEIAVNVSAAQSGRTGFPAFVRDTLALSSRVSGSGAHPGGHGISGNVRMSGERPQPARPAVRRGWNFD